MLDVKRIIQGPVRTNCYLITDQSTGATAIVDPAWDSQEILAEIASRQLSLEKILITHCHFDHIAALSDLQRETDAQVVAHPLASERFHWSADSAKQWGFEIETPLAASLLLEDDESSRLGESRFTALFVPGHSPGHLAYYFADANCLFSGDALFRESIGRTDIVDADHDTLMSSITRKLLTLPEATIVYPGHGRQTTIGEELERNPFLQDVDLPGRE